VDINIIRSLVTVVMLIAFVGIVMWAWSAKRKRDFEQAAQLPFVEDEREHIDARQG
jgi:cytochrome c oxidase cbb3-type subunit IV